MLTMLRKSHLFQGATDDEIREFITAYPCTTADYHNNECIISRDQTPAAIGIVLDGSLGIYTDSFYGGHTLIGLGDQDYLFGFIAMFFNTAKSITTLYCRNACRIAYFRIPPGMSPDRFIRNANPKILANIYAMLTKHIRDDFDRMHLISSPSVRVRLARYLLYRHNTTGSPQVDLLFNRSELADYLSMYRTSLSRELKRFADTGVIRLHRSLVDILDLEALIAIERDSYERPRSLPR